MLDSNFHVVTVYEATHAIYPRLVHTALPGAHSRLLAMRSLMTSAAFGFHATMHRGAGCAFIAAGRPPATISILIPIDALVPVAIYVDIAVAVPAYVEMMIDMPLAVAITVLVRIIVVW
jgi:hypothetical protein